MTNVQSHYDVIIVGGGHNGLVCANYLAKSGRKVLILEANESLGGAATTREFADKDPNPENQSLPILGANDGASGVAVLLTLAEISVSYTHLTLPTNREV